MSSKELPIVKVTRLPRRYSHRRQSNRVIHITIRPTSFHPIPATKKHHHLHGTSSKRSVLPLDQCSQSIPRSTGEAKFHRFEKDTFQHEAKQRGMDSNTENYHRTRKELNKKKQLRCCVIVIVLIALILLALITTILLILLIKPKTTSIQPTGEVLLRWNRTGITIAGGHGQGNGSNQLNTPWDAVLDYQNTLYVADRNNHRIQKFLMGASTGTTVAGTGMNGTSLNQLMIPSRVLPDVNGNIRIADTGNHRVLFWQKDAASGSIIAGIGGRGSSNNQLMTPYGIAHDQTSDTLYIADHSNYRIMRYLSGASSGSVVAGGNGWGNNFTQLTPPVGLYFDSLSNSLIIVNNYAHNIVRWSLGASNWTLLAGDVNGNLGSNATTLRLPTDVTVDPMGNMYVADRNNNRIQFFFSGQLEGITIAGITNTGGANSTLLSAPWSIEIDNQLNLYVADSLNHRVQKFVRY